MKAKVFGKKNTKGNLDNKQGKFGKVIFETFYFKLYMCKWYRC